MKRSAIVLISVFCFGLVAYALVQGGRIDDDELQRLVEILRIEDGDIVADVGAGDGRWAVALAPVVGDSGRIYATEVDPNDLHGISK